jgi:hypothetical protein
MVQKQRQSSIQEAIKVQKAAPGDSDGNSYGGGVVTPGSAAVKVNTGDESVRAVRHTRLTLTALNLAVAAADDYGGVKLCDLPDTNGMLLAVELDLVLTKQANTNGIVAATDLLMGVGTATAGAADLSGGTDDNILTGISLTATAAAPALQVHSNDDASITYPKKFADGGTALYLNCGTSITADSSLSVSGTVDIYWIDLGNVTS